MNKYKICVVGSGNWGMNHIRTLFELDSLVGIVDSEENNFDKLKKKYPQVNIYKELDKAINDNYDGYIVATPPKTHFPIAKKIIESKSNILIEKPITTSLEKAKELNELAKLNNVKLMVGHLLLFHPAILKIKEIIDNGKIGEIQYLYSNRLNLGTIRKDENVLWSFAPHDIAIFQFIVGMLPVKVDSIGSDIIQEGIHDTTITYLEYPKKISGHIFVNWMHPFKEHRFIVIGSKGMISFEDSHDHKPLIFYDKNIKWDSKRQPLVSSSIKKYIEYKNESPLRNELEYFLRSFNEKLDKSDGNSAIEVMKILTKATDKL